MQDVVKTNPQSGQRRRKKRRRRRGNMSLYYLLLFVVAVIILYILSRTVFFKVENYEISGNSRYSNSEILAAAGLGDSENLYNIDLSATGQRIKKALIYIDDVSVSRELPDTIVIEITEAEEFACCQYEGNRYAVISRSGRYLSTEQAEPNEELLQIYGLDLIDVSLGDEFTSSDENKKSIIMNLLDVIDDICPGKIDYIDITDRTDITMSYGGGRIIIDFGSSLDYEYKMRYLITIIEANLDADASGELIYISSSSGVSFIPDEGLEELEQSKDKVADMAGNEVSETEASEETEP
ncbi:MAG: FtsQ-type POTRA domain-containing protein [Oscillospiraceae bacterium]|nr:FtsQ-type POTRA domain-containing protein [Oscillospiraceae bacterium]